MKLEIPSFADAPMSGEFAFCIPVDEGHVLAESGWTGAYTLNPSLRS